MSRTLSFGAAAAVLCALTSAPAAAAGDDGSRFERLPANVVGPVLRNVYDGVTDDLLTAGLGRSGLASPAAPTPVDPLAPTAAELRRLAIYSNYRALLDMTPGGGYGRLYGPNIDEAGADTGGEGLVPGVEYLALLDRRRRVTAMVQIPESFDPASPCVVTAASSGSRGVYGAIATSGEWGLKNGCAVAYTDKGTGTGAHALGPDTVSLIDGRRVDADAAGDASTFTVEMNDRRRLEYDAAFPHRFAFKHAHSQLNPEENWGQDVLHAIEFAFYALNREHPGADLRPDNTIVIASSVSNGGGAAVLAAEQDRQGLIDGVAVSEPNVNPRFNPAFVIRQEGRPPIREHSRSLHDYTSLLNVYMGCAAEGASGAPLNFAKSSARCASLYEAGLLTAATLAEQAGEAQAILNDYGFLPEQNLLAPSHWFLNVPQAIGVTYANAYAKAGVSENLCGYSFAATDSSNAPAPLPETAEVILFGVSNGIPPTGGVNLINNKAPGGPRLDRISTPDQNLDGHLCLRSLEIGADPVTGRKLRGERNAASRKIAASIDRIRASGDLGGRPAIFVTGRSDAILPPNHTSRAYFGLNRTVEGEASGLSYVEVLNAQHLDALNAVPGFDALYIPLHHYFVQALDLMLAHLREGEPLPPSQLVRTTPRQPTPTGAAPIRVEANLPAIAATPAAGDEIVFDGAAVRIPN